MVRVDSQAESGSTGRVDLSRVIAGLLLVGAALLVVLAGYFLVTTCWEGSLIRLEDRLASDCRRGGAVGAVGVLVLAQILGAAGFVIFRWASRNGNSGDAGRVNTDSAPRPPVMGGASFAMNVAFSVVLLGVAVLFLYAGVFLVFFSCWVWQGSPAECSLGMPVGGVVLGALGEPLVVMSLLHGRWAFRGRPWRRDGTERQSMT